MVESKLGVSRSFQAGGWGSIRSWSLTGLVQGLSPLMQASREGCLTAVNHGRCNQNLYSFGQYEKAFTV